MNLYFKPEIGLLVSYISLIFQRQSVLFRRFLFVLKNKNRPCLFHIMKQTTRACFLYQKTRVPEIGLLVSYISLIFQRQSVLFRRFLFVLKNKNRPCLFHIMKQTTRTYFLCQKTRMPEKVRHIFIYIKTSMAEMFYRFYLKIKSIKHFGLKTSNLKRLKIPTLIY